MTGVRYREDTGFEGKCDYCRSWWPVTPEFWRPHSGMRRCKACWSLYHREHEAGRRKEDIYHDMKLTRDRERYAMNRHKALEANRRWKAKHREHIAAYNRAYREAHRDELRQKRREYESVAHDAILLKKRMRYADERAA